MPADSRHVTVPPADDSDYRPAADHVWVEVNGMTSPGLLIAWERTRGGWAGQVVHRRDVGGQWVVVQEMVPADRLRQRPRD